jgi:small subunit ribosomal protein S16
MPVKIRLTRMGKKKQPSYRVVVVDSRRPRDGAYIEQIGRYDPRQDPSLIEIDNEKALDWLGKGAQPTDRVRKLLEISGAWTRFRVVKGDIHTVGEDAPAAPAKKAAEEPVAEEPVVDEPVVEEPEAEAEPQAEAEPKAAPEAVEEVATVAEAVEEGEDDEG